MPIVGAVRCGAVRCGAVRCGAVRCGSGRQNKTRNFFRNIFITLLCLTPFAFAAADSIGIVRDTSSGQVVFRLGILFETNDSKLPENAKNALEKVAAVFVAQENTTVRVEGHTDTEGTPERNAQLSGERAAAVRDFLVASGVAANRLSFVGHGFNKPITSNETSEGRAINRRVELIVDDNAETVAFIAALSVVVNEVAGILSEPPLSEPRYPRLEDFPDSTTQVHLSEPGFPELSEFTELQNDEQTTQALMSATATSHSPLATSQKTSTWIALGLDIIGAAVLGFGIYKHIDANSKHSDYKKEYNVAPDSPSLGLSYAELQALDSRQRSDLSKANDARKTGNVAVIVGSVLLTSGVIIHVWF